jgi:hypothetical protein
MSDINTCLAPTKEQEEIKNEIADDDEDHFDFYDDEKPKKAKGKKLLKFRKNAF